MTPTPLSPFPNMPLRQADVMHVALWVTTTDAVLMLDVDRNLLRAHTAVPQVPGYRPEQVVGSEVPVEISFASIDLDGQRLFVGSNRRNRMRRMPNVIGCRGAPVSPSTLILVCVPGHALPQA